MSFMDTELNLKKKAVERAGDGMGGRAIEVEVKVEVEVDIPA